MCAERQRNSSRILLSHATTNERWREITRSTHFIFAVYLSWDRPIGGTPCTWSCWTPDGFLLSLVFMGGRDKSAQRCIILPNPPPANMVPSLPQAFLLTLISYLLWRTLRPYFVKTPLSIVPGPPSASWWKGNMLHLAIPIGCLISLSFSRQLFSGFQYLFSLQVLKFMLKIT